MIKGDKEFLDQVARTHRCPEHDKPLVVAWHAGENSYVLRCGAGHFPEEVTREMSLTEMHKAGIDLPEPIKSNVQKGMARRAQAAGRQPVTNEYALVPQLDLGTGQLLLPEELRFLVSYAHKYQLDPFRGHVVMMYSKPYITLDGYLYHAMKENVPFSIKSRPLETEERKTYQINEGDHAWVAEVVILDAQKSFIGLGVVTREEMEARSEKKPDQLRSPVVAAHPWQLAQKRAEWQALRRAFPIGETEEAKRETRDESQISG